MRSCPRVASAAGSGSASMPVASPAGSGSASMPVASAAGSGSASMPVASAAGSGSASMRLGSGQWICVLPAAVGHPRVQIPLDLRAWPAAGARQRGQNSAILPALPRQRVVDLHLCPSSWKRAVDLRTARCMLLDTPVLYMGNAFQSLVLVDLLGAVQPSSLRTALVDLLVEELKPVSHPAAPLHDTALACGSVPYRGPSGSGQGVLVLHAVRLKNK